MSYLKLIKIKDYFEIKFNMENQPISEHFDLNTVSLSIPQWEQMHSQTEAESICDVYEQFIQFCVSEYTEAISTEDYSPENPEFVMAGYAVSKDSADFIPLITFCPMFAETESFGFSQGISLFFPDPLTNDNVSEIGDKLNQAFTLFFADMIKNNIETKTNNVLSKCNSNT